ncbi:DNA repair RAD52-like protein 2, chloroplastic isoform X2 [Telopea speciosissima]|uniref:DNA repair RAD52-like protein 2, chloroplastic isoform X2 n=1 Tax=Telopea speciosissima TaxID=54955 RepID=UPI001CC82A06|nr:DNA repair RAD52-like protein 2, chloroplastic isoform X2 [Telopea speciosissima]
MALHNAIFLNKFAFPATENRVLAISSPLCGSCTSDELRISRRRGSRRPSLSLVVWALEKNSGGGGSSSNAVKKSAVPNSNYVVPLDKSSCIMRPLAEILRDLNKRVPDKIIKPDTNYIPWYHANRMLSFYAPGWCGEIRDVIFADNGGVTVVYRVTIHGSDGEVCLLFCAFTFSSSEGGTP